MYVCTTINHNLQFHLKSILYLLHAPILQTWTGTCLSQHFPCAPVAYRRETEVRHERGRSPHFTPPIERKKEWRNTRDRTTPTFPLCLAEYRREKEERHERGRSREMTGRKARNPHENRRFQDLFQTILRINLKLIFLICWIYFDIKIITFFR